MIVVHRSDSSGHPVKLIAKISVSIFFKVRTFTGVVAGLVVCNTIGVIDLVY
jgi:hypothetical protein